VGIGSRTKIILEENGNENVEVENEAAPPSGLGKYFRFVLEAPPLCTENGEDPGEERRVAIHFCSLDTCADSSELIPF
jgi:hypothetical protein